MVDTRQVGVLSAMGIEVFRLRDAESEAPSEETPSEEATSVLRTLDWPALAEEVRSCTLCDLSRTRTQTVFGVGRPDADLMIIGEAPGADEDRQGEPFVGRAGQLLNSMLRAIGLGREDVYIANILKCRPPNNRDPQPEEAARCSPYLERQIELVEPRAVLAVGRIAAQHLLQSDLAIGRLRGQVLSFGAQRIPLVATYHPAYLLRSPQAKAKAWQDLCLIRGLITQRQ
ncbi:MAG: uracil-DNA glycosylase [Gammaproteobacteria bacterium]|jgi:DNA polymerase